MTEGVALVGEALRGPKLIKHKVICGYTECVNNKGYYELIFYIMFCSL